LAVECGSAADAAESFAVLLNQLFNPRIKVFSESLSSHRPFLSMTIRNVLAG